MNLLYITLTKHNKLVSGGAELERLRGLAKKFNYVHIVCRGSSLCFYEDLVIEGVSLLDMNRYCTKLSPKFDWVMAGSLNLDGLIAVQTKNKTCIRCGGEYNYKNLLKDGLSKLVQKKVLSKVDRLVVNSYYLQNKLGGFVVHNGVNLRKFSPRSKVPKYSGKGVYLGRVRKDKGVDIINRINHETNHRIDIISGVPHDKVPRILKEYDFLILPSTSTSSESLPNVLLEAMACGVPCIASNIAGISEILPDEALFEENNFEDIRDHLFKLQDKDFRDYLVKEGFKVAKAHNITKMNKELYKGLFK